jgi:hypothetical protein
MHAPYQALRTEIVGILQRAGVPLCACPETVVAMFHLVRWRRVRSGPGRCFGRRGLCRWRRIRPSRGRGLRRSVRRSSRSSLRSLARTNALSARRPTRILQRYHRRLGVHSHRDAQPSADPGSTDIRSASHDSVPYRQLSYSEMISTFATIAVLPRARTTWPPMTKI